MSRPRLIAVSLAAVVVAFLAVRGVAGWRGGSGRIGSSSTAKAAAGLEARTIEAGAVTVKIEPRRVDAAGAEFSVTFDTHSGDLGLDVARNAHLVVAGSQWTGSTWSGDGPGGHHRAGTLRFTSGGSATGTAELHLSGLPAPVSASWTLGGG